MIKNIDFNVDYSKLNIIEEYNTDDIKSPLILSIPHAGQIFPTEFLSAISQKEETLRQNEDLFVNELVANAIQSGIPAISLNISRSFIDVNRAKVELDPDMFYNYPDDELNLNQRRSRYGLGIIHKVTANSSMIYNGKISYNEVQDRISNIYNAYHDRLKEIIAKTKEKFGFCVLLDCHSMPSKICDIISENPRIDFCIGNLFDQSCTNKMTSFVEGELSRRNYYVSKNRPYSGAFITFNYCKPRDNEYTMQLEINRSIYAQEDKLEKNNNFQDVSTDVSNVINNFSKFLLAI